MDLDSNAWMAASVAQLRLHGFQPLALPSALPRELGVEASRRSA